MLSFQRLILSITVTFLILVKAMEREYICHHQTLPIQCPTVLITGLSTLITRTLQSPSLPHLWTSLHKTSYCTVFCVLQSVLCACVCIYVYRTFSKTLCSSSSQYICYAILKLIDKSILNLSILVKQMNWFLQGRFVHIWVLWGLCVLGLLSTDSAEFYQNIICRISLRLGGNCVLIFSPSKKSIRSLTVVSETLMLYSLTL